MSDILSTHSGVRQGLMYKDNVTKSIWEPSINGGSKSVKNVDYNTIARPYAMK